MKKSMKILIAFIIAGLFLGNDTAQCQSTDQVSLEKDTVLLKIQFKDMVLILHSFSATTADDQPIKGIQKNALTIFAELGETIEGQRLSIATTQLTDVVIEQRYETSITISNEGPHCDLKAWRHSVSPYKKLKIDKTGDFICNEYSEVESAKFPKVTMHELKAAVQKHCGTGYARMIAHIKSVNDYPVTVSISRYFLRITAKQKSDGKIIQKIIMIDNPMGC